MDRLQFKDPLFKTGPAAQAELFDRFRNAANGFPLEAAIGASLNVLINALRQTYPKREDAESCFDEIVARAKGVLLDEHYDSRGRKKGLFPFHQRIEVPVLVDPDFIQNR